jgi:IS30 family transposase
MPYGRIGRWEEIDEFFRVLKTGVSISQAARVVGRPRTTANDWVKRWGMEMLKGSRAGAVGAPFADDGAGKGRLQAWERGVIMAGVRRGASCAEIGRELGRDRSVVWREIDRNGGRGDYQADAAHIRACQGLARPKEFALDHQPLARFVEEAMDQGWSPKLISLALPQEFPDDEKMRISHETIYRALYVQGRGQLRQDLYKALSTGRARRVPEGRAPGGRRASPFQDALKISERPPEVQDRAVPGHWEADLILSGAGSSAAIGVLVERTTRYTMLLHLPHGRSSEQVCSALVAAMQTLPADLRRTLTYDRGSELARYRDVQTALDLQVYFCDPHSPWQRGTNENTNRLLRHWFKKGSDLSAHTAEDLKRVQDSLNNRPRPTLGLDTPHHRLKQLIAQAQAT